MNHLFKIMRLLAEEDVRLYKQPDYVLAKGTSEKPINTIQQPHPQGEYGHLKFKTLNLSPGEIDKLYDHAASLPANHPDKQNIAHAIYFSPNMSAGTIHKAVKHALNIEGKPESSLQGGIDFDKVDDPKNLKFMALLNAAISPKTHPKTLDMLTHLVGTKNAGLGSIVLDKLAVHPKLSPENMMKLADNPNTQYELLKRQDIPYEVFRKIKNMKGMNLPDNPDDLAINNAIEALGSDPEVGFHGYLPSRYDTNMRSIFTKQLKAINKRNRGLPKLTIRNPHRLKPGVTLEDPNEGGY